MNCVTICSQCGIRERGNGRAAQEEHRHVDGLNQDIALLRGIDDRGDDQAEGAESDATARQTKMRAKAIATEWPSRKTDVREKERSG